MGFTDFFSNEDVQDGVFHVSPLPIPYSKNTTVFSYDHENAKDAVSQIKESYTSEKEDRVADSKAIDTEPRLEKINNSIQNTWIPSIEGQVIVAVLVQYLLWISLEVWSIHDHYLTESKDSGVLFSFVLNIYRCWMVFFTLISYGDYLYWKEEYPGKKFCRTDPRCISNKQPPKLTGEDKCWRRFSQSLVSCLKLKKPSCLTKQESLDDDVFKDAGSKNSQRFRQRFRNVQIINENDESDMNNSYINKSRKSFVSNNNNYNNNDNDSNNNTYIGEKCPAIKRGLRASTPGNMDHLFMTFLEYLYVTWLLRPSAYILMFFGGQNCGGVCGILWLRLKEWIGQRKGGIKEEASMAEARLVTFILESLSIMVRNVRECPITGSLLGDLHIKNIAHISCEAKENSFKPGDILIQMDIGNRRVLDASFAGQPISNQDALCLCFNAWAGLVHPVVHAYANWGSIVPEVNGEEKSENVITQFLRKMSLITSKYNNFGSDGFRVAMAFLKSIGVNKYVGNDFGLLSTCHGAHIVPSHKDIFKLKKHSRFVDFIHNVRGIFLLEFTKFKADFPGVNAECLFLGTVYHSVDHHSAAVQLKISDLRYESKKYAGDCELARVILNSFVDTPPLRMFECRFSHAPHPLFTRVYEQAKKIDVDFADAMECCIAV